MQIDKNLIAKVQKMSEKADKMIKKTVSEHGGHYGSPLAASKLIAGLIEVFDFQKDKIIFDTGHQCYAYKILTDRENSFHSLRQEGGISGFPDIAESPYDHFGTGHSGTSVSAMSGFLLGSCNDKKDKDFISFVGDSAMTGGVFFEGLNLISSLGKKNIIIINDNNFSICPPVGSLSQHLRSLKQQNFKKTVGDNLTRCKGNIFESLGCEYYGVFDGEDVESILKVLAFAKNHKTNSTIVLHFITSKDKHALAGEQNYEFLDKSSLLVSRKISDIIAKDKNCFFVSPAMLSGSGLAKIKSKYPNNIIDVAIAEQCAVLSSAGIASIKKENKVFCALYSTFSQRAYDQIIHDVTIQNLPVKFILDRSGFVGKDGKTHQGLFDMSMFGAIPNAVILSPKDSAELSNMIDFCYSYNKGPTFLRIPKAIQKADKYNHPEAEIKCGKFEKVSMNKGSKGPNVCILSFGHIFTNAYKAYQKLVQDEYSVTIFNARFMKPVDTESLNEISRKFDLIVTVEIGYSCGFSALINESLNKINYGKKVINIKAEDRYYDHGTEDYQIELSGLSGKSIYQKIINKLSE